MGAATAPELMSPRRTMLSLVVLAAASFVYVTAETLPVGILPQLSRGLHVSHGDVGLLVTVYAGVAGLAAIPLSAWSNHLPRRRLVVAALTLLAVSQAAMALSPDYGAFLGSRILCALGHGVFWSILAPVAASLVAPERAGRATAIVFAGNSLALVLGTPIATAIGQLVGWRAANGVVGAAAAVAVVAALVVLPPLPSAAAGSTARDRMSTVSTMLGRRSVLGVCAVTTLIVAGHFTVYTYIADIVRRDGSLTGLALTLVLLLYGIAGIAGNGVIGLVVDPRPRLAGLGSVAGVAVALAGLALLGPGSAIRTVVVVVVWGAAFTAVPVAMQSAVLHAGSDEPNTASAVLVVAFQLGIGGGALVGSFFVGAGRLADLPAVGSAFAFTAMLVLVAARRSFPSRRGARGSALDDEQVAVASHG